METLKAISKRRSVRAYEDRQIPREDLEIILAAGGAAAMGMRAYDRLHLAAVSNPEVLEKLNGAVSELMAKVMPNRPAGNALHGAPCAVIVSAREPENNPMAGMHYINSGCVVENMMLAAADRGIGSVVLGIVGDVVKGSPELKQAMGIPEDFTPLFALALGYSADGLDIEKTMEQTIAVSYVD